MGKRANPGSSLEAARRHLFRHFHDVKELRRNPLCAPFFQAARAQRRPAPDHAALLNVHRGIRKIVEDYESSTMGEPDGEPLRRQLALFKAYIFERRPWEELAAELGLSRRQFFRDYASVRDRILEGFAHWGPPSHVEQWLERDELPISQAGLLIQANMLDEAAKRLRETAMHETRGETRARALCTLARLAMDDARYAEAESLLHAAVEETENTALRAEIGVLNKYLQWYSCGTASAQGVPSVDRARLAYDRNNQAISAAYLHLLMYEAAYMTWVGNFADAYRVIQRAKALLDTESSPSIEDRLGIAQIYSVTIAALSPQNLPQSISLLTEAVDLARKNGFVRSALLTSSTLGMHFVGMGNMKAAHSLFDRCLKAGESLNDRSLHMTLQIDLGDPAAVGAECSRARLERVLPLLPDADWRAPGVCLLLAVASAELQQQDHALAELERANRLAGRAGNMRISGATLRELAALQFQSGQTRQAKETIGDAVAVLERHGNAYSLAKAYRAYASITGDQRFLQKAAAL